MADKIPPNWTLLGEVARIGPAGTKQPVARHGSAAYEKVYEARPEGTTQCAC
jgi:hypothetical protein